MTRRWGTVGLVSVILVAGAIGFGSYRLHVDPAPTTQTDPNLTNDQTTAIPAAPQTPVAPAQVGAPVMEAAPITSTPPVASTAPATATPSVPPEAPAPAPAPAEAVIMTPSTETGSPVRLRIPSLRVDAPVVPVGLTDTGAMAAPPGYDHVGWYEYGARPGDPGRAVIAGHVDSQNGPAVFWDLKDLVPGDTLLVYADSELLHTYKINEIEVYEADHAPLQRIFGPSNTRELILITCGGTFDTAVRDYSHRVVVYASY